MTPSFGKVMARVRREPKRNGKIANKTFAKSVSLYLRALRNGDKKEIDRHAHNILEN